MTVQLEYINHLLQFFKNIFYYAGIMLNAFSDLLCSKLCWHNWLVPISHTFCIVEDMNMCQCTHTESHTKDYLATTYHTCL